MKYKKDNCSKCSKSTWDLIIADGKFDSNKGKLYCGDCYYNKARKKWHLEDSVDLMDWIKYGDEAFNKDIK